MSKKELAHESEQFNEKYWRENYATPEEMDGVVNAKEHARYIKAFFSLEYVDISTIIDFGFGLGHLFEACLEEFYPYRAWGIEPSRYAFDQVKKRGIKPCDSTSLTLKPWSISQWCDSLSPRSKWFDLGICTSVFQYIPDDELKVIIAVMARKVKYLYLSVPTDFELDRQIKDHDFKDEYALRRSKQWYLAMIEPHFTVIGSRVLESKFHFNEDNTFFTDYLFRK